ncbi:MAG TPA: class I SAM-dependent methyltransferase, partial [Chitinophagales bacterium]|nr:class I SAM-dependent methyltransferase [Chitinophagales bacterium]
IISKCCYFWHRMIPYISPQSKELLFFSGSELKSASGESFKLVNGIPRFVPADNYANAFGLQWKNYAKTQLDSFSGTKISQERLERCLGMPIAQLKEKNILEVGAGAGRFTELLVKGGANVHSVDLSVAVEVNKENIGDKPNYTIAQASVYELPFAAGSFDIVVCLGVIQHTPSSEKTIEALWNMVRPGGLLVIDHYIWRINYYFNPATYYRLILKEMPPARSKKIVDSLVNFFFPLHWAFRNAPFLEWCLKRFSPLITFMKSFPELGKEQQYEWAKLDTYDSLTDYYKHLRSPEQIRRRLEGLGGQNIWINKGGNGVEARSTKPA